MISQRYPNIYGYLQNDLKLTMPYLKGNWIKQRDDLDKLTSFIYYSSTFEDLEYEYERIKNQVDFSYVAHRWYNYKTSKMTENIFTSFDVCRAEENKKHKTIDLYIFDTPFDIKVTAFPYAFKKERKDFPNDRSYRNALIQWFYKHQSSEQRMHIANRLFVVCKGESSDDNNYSSKLLKSDFPQIEKKIYTYLSYLDEKRRKFSSYKFNQVHIRNNGVLHKPFSDIIFIQ